MHSCPYTPTTTVSNSLIHVTCRCDLNYYVPVLKDN